MQYTTSISPRLLNAKDPVPGLKEVQDLIANKKDLSEYLSTHCEFLRPQKPIAKKEDGTTKHPRHYDGDRVCDLPDHPYTVHFMYHGTGIVITSILEKELTPQ